MTGAEIALILKLIDLAILGFQHLPKRDARRELALKQLRAKANSGEPVTQAEIDSALVAIATLSSERDNIIAIKEAINA